MSGSTALPARDGPDEGHYCTNSWKRPEMVSVKRDGSGDVKWQTCTEKWPLPREVQTRVDSARKTVLTGQTVLWIKDAVLC